MSTFDFLLSIFSLISLAVAYEKDPCWLEPFQGRAPDDKCRMYPEPSSWSYDPNFNECRQFTFSGCGENNNLFRTSKKCEAMCKTTNPCEMKPFSANANGDGIGCRMLPVEAWSYVDESNECVKYDVGCSGNDNSFSTPEDCENKCKKKDPCAMTPFPGKANGDGQTCSMITEAWSYVGKSKKCEKYYYNGCGGDDNHFDTPEDCEAQCQKNA